MVGVNDIVIVNTNTGKQMMLSDSPLMPQRSRNMNNTITKCLWFDDKTLLLNTQE